MNTNQIQDEPYTKKPSNNCWKGARYFGYGIAPIVTLSAVTYLLQQLISNKPEPTWHWWMIAIMFLLFFNMAGFLISLDYTLTGNNSKEKVAGFLSLLLNTIPFLIFLYFLIDLGNYESNL